MIERKLEVGKQAVREAMRISRVIQREMSAGESISKSDKSPVTIADFTSQAIICRILKTNYPDVPIVAEESSAILQQPENALIVDKMMNFIERDAEIKRILNRENLFESIDFGTQSPGDHFWTLDPIDGTKGFLRGEQYAIALALINKGKVELGILGCPNLKLDHMVSDQGFLFSARYGQGTVIINAANEEKIQSNVSNQELPDKMRFVQSYESSHGNMPLQLEISKSFGMDEKPVQMDSQVKYGVVSTGDAEIYVRIPHPSSPNYKEKIWDHAAGSLLVTEAGGVVSDILGAPLNFGVGKTLSNNTGILVSIPKIHTRLVEIIRELI